MYNGRDIGQCDPCVNSRRQGTQIVAVAISPQSVDHLKFYGYVLAHKFIGRYTH